jgi:hypothetical protein
VAPRYATPRAFRDALEARIQTAARAASMDVTRVRQSRIFERFVARLTAHLGERVVVKGGVVLELRLAGARSTRDVDLRVSGSPEALLAELRLAGQLDLGDFLMFDVTPDPRNPTIDTEGMIYEGRRFRVQAMLAQKVYGDQFGVDAAFGDRMMAPPEVIEGSDFFAFAGLPRSASTRARCTSPRSSTRSRCRAPARTPA